MPSRSFFIKILLNQGFIN